MYSQVDDPLSNDLSISHVLCTLENGHTINGNCLLSHRTLPPLLPFQHGVILPDNPPRPSGTMVDPAKNPVSSVCRNCGEQIAYTVDWMLVPAQKPRPFWRQRAPIKVINQLELHSPPAVNSPGITLSLPCPLEMHHARLTPLLHSIRSLVLEWYFQGQGLAPSPRTLTCSTVLHSHWPLTLAEEFHSSILPKTVEERRTR
jgi:hypothetical protein